MLAVAFLAVTLATASAPAAAALVVNADGSMAPAHVEPIETAVRHALSDDKTLRLLAPADTALGVDQAREAGWQCDGGDACMAQLGRALGVNTLFELTLQAQGARSASVTLRAFDVERAVATGRLSVQITPGTKSGALGRLARAVTGRGAVLVVTAPTTIKQLSVDGEQLVAGGSTIEIAGFGPGAHDVHAVLADGSVFEQEAVVRGARRVEVRLAQAGSGFVWLFGSGAGAIAASAGVLLGVAAAAVTVLGVTAVASLNREPNGTISARAGQSRAAVERQLNVGLALGGAGAATGMVALATGVVSAIAAGLCVAGYAWNRMRSA